MADWSNRMANDGSRWYSDLTILPGETLADEIAAPGMSFDLAVCPRFHYPEDFDREKYDAWLGYSGITGRPPVEDTLVNPLISDLLHRIEFIEKAGTGIRRIREEARARRDPPHQAESHA